MKSFSKFTNRFNIRIFILNHEYTKISLLMKIYGRTPKRQILKAFRLSLSKSLLVLESKLDQGPATVDLLYQLIIGAQRASSNRVQPIIYTCPESNARPGLKPNNPAHRALLNQGLQNTNIIIHNITIAQQFW